MLSKRSRVHSRSRAIAPSLRGVLWTEAKCCCYKRRSAYGENNAEDRPFHSKEGLAWTRLAPLEPVQAEAEVERFSVAALATVLATQQVTRRGDQAQ